MGPGLQGWPGTHLQLTRAAHLQLTRAAHLQIAMSLWGVGPRPKGPMGTPLLGKYTREKARRGWDVHLGVSLGYPPRCSGTIRGSRRAFLAERDPRENMVYPFLPIFTDFLGRILLPCCYSTCMLQVKPRPIKKWE